jgi:adenylate cyclase
VVGNPMQRWLTTVLAADVAGCSRLTGADEEGTVARLPALRHQLIDPMVAAYGGRPQLILKRNYWVASGNEPSLRSL